MINSSSLDSQSPTALPQQCFVITFIVFYEEISRHGVASLLNGQPFVEHPHGFGSRRVRRIFYMLRRYHMQLQHRMVYTVCNFVSRVSELQLGYLQKLFQPIGQWLAGERYQIHCAILHHATHFLFRPPYLLRCHLFMRDKLVDFP
ncbi:hypothetical protein SUGI_0934060 [Cryptomeria japonica]|nr:hypothetical protein SUGI_0934060 [Cryptomeria japonica]